MKIGELSSKLTTGIIIAILASCAVSSTTCPSAQAASGWSKTYGGTGTDHGWGETIQTSDGGYAIAGDTDSFGAGGYDFWLIKTDADGNMQWNKTYGGALNEQCDVMCQTSEGGYALAGSTSSFGAGGYDFWIVKTDSAGVMQWNKTFGGTGNEGVLAVVQTSEGGYALAGNTSSFGAGLDDFWLVKTDAAGNMLWNKTYGGIGKDVAYGLVQTSEGGYAMAGYTQSFGAGGADVWLVKTDTNGNMQWNKTFGGTGTEWAVYLVRSSDGGYAIPGYTTSSGGFRAYLVKTDASGNMEWNKTFTGNGEVAHHAIQTTDGGYALAGFKMMAPIGWLLIKTDTSGNMEWNRTYPGGDAAYSVIQTSDGGYAMTGNTKSFGAGGYDIWLVKVDASGVIPEFSSLLLLSSALAATGFIAIGKKKRFLTR